MKSRSVIIIGAVLALSVLMAACGGAEPSESPMPDMAEDSPQPGLVTQLEDVMKAVVQIEAQGTFVDPEFGLQENAAGSGSGFIIDPSGIAVTNNHVVTGAALLKVRIAGEDVLRNAKILGVSECSDLAVIDIDGDGYAYLDWYDSTISVGLDIYVAGFPLGDPEFTLTRGIISKAKADGESYWASVDSVVEYDATTNPGNSGGPVVTEDGKVVAVHYSGNSGTRQAFGISRDIAESVIQQLRGGEDLDSIGVNGEAVSATDGSFTGIWIASVKSGSPADEAGLSGGDIILTMEGLDLASDGSMSSYCDILRTHEADDTLSIEVLRWATGETLSGQLNGRALAVSGSLGPPSGSSSGGASGGGDGNYTTILDDTESLEVAIPSAWSDVDGTDWTDEAGIYHYSIWAAPSIDGFINTWDTPGLIYEITPTGGDVYGGYLNYLDYLTTDIETICSYDSQEDYDDGAFQGAYRMFSSCGGTGTGYFVMSAYPAGSPEGYSVRIEFQLVRDADWDALDRVLDTFNVVAPLGQALPGGVAFEGDGYDQYLWLEDDYNSITMQVPAAWGDVDGSPWVYEGEVIGGMISASSDLDGYFDTWLVPGVTFAASDDLARQLGYLELLNGMRPSFMDACELDGRYDYEDSLYRGKYDLFTKCGGSGGSNWMQLSAVSKDDQFAFLIFIQAQIVDDRDWGAIDQVLNTFEVIGQLP